MAPTVCIGEIGGDTIKRRHFSLEEHLYRALRLSHNDDSVRCTHIKRSPHYKSLRCDWNNKVVKGMGLVVDPGVREGDSPGLPPHYHSCSPPPPSQAHQPAHQGSPQYNHLSKKEGLIDITLRTMALLKRNQLLQRKLTALQLETRAFVKSVLSEQGACGSSSPVSPPEPIQ